MTARHQGLDAGPVSRAKGLVAAHHVADGVYLHFVKAAVAHIARNALGAGTVRIGQVSDRELAFFGITGVAVLCQLFLPVPDQVAQRGFGAEPVVQANLGDAVDVAQGLGQFEVGVVVQPAREGLDDFLLCKAGATRAAHGQNEGKAEPGVVAGVELLDSRELVRAAICQAGLVLLVA